MGVSGGSCIINNLEPYKLTDFKKNELYNIITDIYKLLQKYYKICNSTDIMRYTAGML